MVRPCAPITPGRTRCAATCTQRPASAATRLRRRAFGLVPLPVADWHGWLFVQATARPAPFAEHIGELDILVAPYAAGDAQRLAARHTYEVAANWKVLTENYHECYHCPLIHPELCQVSPPTSGDNYELPRRLGRRLHGPARRHGHDVARRQLGRPSDPDGVDPRRCSTSGCSPTCCSRLHPDYVMTHRLLPLAPDRTRVECSWFFAADDAGGPNPAYAVDFWDLTNRQDWARLRVGAAGAGLPALPAGPVRAQRGRGARVRHPDRACVPRERAVRAPRVSRC